MHRHKRYLYQWKMCFIYKMSIRSQCYIESFKVKRNDKHAHHQIISIFILRVLLVGQIY